MSYCIFFQRLFVKTYTLHMRTVLHILPTPALRSHMIWEMVPYWYAQSCLADCKVGTESHLRLHHPLQVLC